MPILAQAQSSNTQSSSGSVAGAGANANFYGGQNTAIYPQNTPSPTAPPFVTASPCMGVMSGSGTSPVVGIALGMSYKDGECEDRANASALNSMGDREAALQVMCQIASVQTAMKAAGTPCSGVVAPTSVAAVAPPDPPAPAVVRAGGGITPLQQFCSTLSPTSAEDRPYLLSECKQY